MFEEKQRYPAFCMILLVVLVLLTGCFRQGSQAVLDLVPLSLQLQAEHGEAHLVVELDDRGTLGVTVVDASVNGLRPDQAEERARNIASFVCKNYRSMDTIDLVWVAFESPQDRFIVDSTSSTTYRFDSSELACDHY